MAARPPRGGGSTNPASAGGGGAPSRPSRPDGLGGVFGGVVRGLGYAAVAEVLEWVFLKLEGKTEGQPDKPAVDRLRSIWLAGVLAWLVLMVKGHLDPVTAFLLATLWWLYVPLGIIVVLVVIKLVFKLVEWTAKLVKWIIEIIK